MLSYWDDWLCSFLWVKRFLHSSVLHILLPTVSTLDETNFSAVSAALKSEWPTNILLIYLARCPNATMLKCCWNRNAAITEIQQRMVEREIRKSFLSLKRRSVKASKPRGSCLVISDGSNFAKLLIILHCYTHIDCFVHVYWMKLLKLDKCVQLEAKGKHVSLHVNHLTHHTLAPFSL